MAEKDGPATTVTETPQQYHRRMTHEIRRSDSIRALQGQVDIIVLPTPPIGSVSTPDAQAPEQASDAKLQEHE